MIENCNTGWPSASRISASAARLSLYLRCLESWRREGTATVSSALLAEALGITDAQVRKDIGYLGSPGQPGVIPAIPPLSFAAFPPGVLPAGTYRIGIACTLSRKTANYWDTEVVITSSPGDKPSQFVWRLPNVPESVNQSSHGSSSWVLPIGIGALAVVAVGAWFFLPRKARVPVKHRRTPQKTNARRPPSKGNNPNRSHKVHTPSPRKATTHSKEPK